MPHIILHIVVAFIYLAVALDYWRMVKAAEAQKLNQLHRMMIALGLALHGWLLQQALFGTMINLSLLNALSAIFWLTVLIYWLADLKHNLTSLQAFVLPPAALFALLPAFTRAAHSLPLDQSKLLIAHIAIAFIAYSLFTFAALHALLMTIAERDLHHQSTRFALPNLPPLMVMESLLFKVLTTGFVLLTLTLLSGMLFSEQIFGKALQFNHKVVFSIISWLIYGWLLYGRYQYGWRGKKAIQLTLWGFGLLLLSYVGTKFVLEILLA